MLIYDKAKKRTERSYDFSGGSGTDTVPGTTSLQVTNQGQGIGSFKAYLSFGKPVQKETDLSCIGCNREGRPVFSVDKPGIILFQEILWMYHPYASLPAPDMEASL
jgi:hypothetical protein